MQSIYDNIREETEAGRPERAIALADRHIAAGIRDARLYYLQGKAYMKSGNWQQAINCFLRSEQIDKDSPAAEARQLLTDILDFYNKDMYNQ